MRMGLGRLSAMGVGVAMMTAGLTGLTGCDGLFGPIDSCFVRGTRVQTPNGTKAIEELAVGDEVISFQEATMALVVRRVTDLHHARVERTRTVVVGSRRIVTTDEHPFWEAERREWMRAGDLQAGATLAMFEEGSLVPVRVDAVIDEPHRDGVDVFNLTVEGPEHTYLADGIAVHNKSRPCDFCGIPGDAGAPRPSHPPLPNDLAIENTTAQTLTIRLRSTVDGARIDESLLVEGSTHAFPAEQITTEEKPFTIAPNELVTIPTGAVTIVKNGMNFSNQRGVVFSLNNTEAPMLIVGHGVIVVAKGAGLSFSVFSANGGGDTHVVPSRESSRLCTGADARPKHLKLPAITDEQIGKRFVLAAPAPTAEEGCTSFVAKREDNEPETLTFEICSPKADGNSGPPGVAMYWPFVADDVVTVEKIGLLVNATGARLARVSDGKEIELAHVTDKDGVLFGAMSEPVGAGPKSEEPSCVIEKAASDVCPLVLTRSGLVNLRNNEPISPILPIEVSDNDKGSAYVLGATQTLYAHGCAKETVSAAAFGATFDVVVHPKKQP